MFFFADAIFGTSVSGIPESGSKNETRTLPVHGTDVKAAQ